MTRLFVDAPLAPGATVELDVDRAHYLRNVLRLQPGAAVALFNGRDGEWSARIERLAKAAATVAVDAQTRPQDVAADLWLLFAPIKRTRIDLVAEKATELGVAALRPVLTQHTAVERVSLDRLRAIAMEAAEQCERLSVPTLLEPVALDRLMIDWPVERRLVVCAEADEAVPIAAALRPYAESPAGNRGPWAILVGPEGGFARSELDALRKLPFVIAVSLGPRILRADTAAVAALACWQAMLGDGHHRPPRPDDQR